MAINCSEWQVLNRIGLFFAGWGDECYFFSEVWTELRWREKRRASPVPSAYLTYVNALKSWGRRLSKSLDVKPTPGRAATVRGAGEVRWG